MMAGHNKCSNVKRMKIAREVKRGPSFSRLAKEICLEPGNTGVNTDATSRLGSTVFAASAESAPNEYIRRDRRELRGRLWP